MAASVFGKKLDGYFIAFCRRLFAWSPAYKIATKRAEVETPKGTRWKCAKCGTLTGKGEKVRDHIEPVVPVKEGWNGSWDAYRDRMGFENPDNIQVLCKPCHKEKTNAENRERRARTKKL